MSSRESSRAIASLRKEVQPKCTAFPNTLEKKFNPKKGQHFLPLSRGNPDARMDSISFFSNKFAKKRAEPSSNPTPPNSCEGRPSPSDMRVDGQRDLHKKYCELGEWTAIGWAGQGYPSFVVCPPPPRPTPPPYHPDILHLISGHPRQGTSHPETWCRMTQAQKGSGWLPFWWAGIRWFAWPPLPTRLGAVVLGVAGEELILVNGRLILMMIMTWTDAKSPLH